MDLYPPTAEAKLGFDILRARLATYLLSPMGEDRLAGMKPSSHLPDVRRSLTEVGEFQDALRFDDPVPFEGLHDDVRPLLRRAVPTGSMLDPGELETVRRVLSVIRLLHGYVHRRRDKYPALWAQVERIAPAPDLERHIESAVDDQGHVRDEASSALRSIRRQIIRQQQSLRASVMHALRSAVGRGYSTEEQPTIRNGRMVIPVRAEAKRKVQGFVHDTSATGQTVYIEPASCLELNNEVRTLQLEEQHEVRRILQALTDHVREHRPVMVSNLDVLAHLDLLQAQARLANRLDAVVPELNEDNILRIRQGRNPVLALRFSDSTVQDDTPERTVVALDLDLGVDYHVLVITGPNAGGKSVAMKTVGLFVLMLASGMPVPVGVGSSFCLFEELLIDIGDEQSIEEDLSTFSSHVANLRTMLDLAGERSLVLIDEAGTGTDPAEGGALAQAVLEALHAAGARTIVTTHHGTLKAFAHDTQGVENASMQFDQHTLSPTYQFRAGIPGSSYAFEVAARIGLEQAVLDRARGLVGRQKTAFEDLIAEFERRTVALREQLAEAEREAGEHRAARAVYEERNSRLRDEIDRIKADALSEAERIVHQANARVERTIREIKEAEAERDATRKARKDLEQYKTSVKNKKAEADRRLQRTRQRARAKEKPKPAARVRPIEIGDQVVLDDADTAAEVLEIEGNQAVIASGSLRMRVDLDRIIRVGGRRPQQVVVRHDTSTAGIPSMRARQRLDVRGKRTVEALSEVDRFLSDGMAAGLARLEIVHGKGTGALRTAIQEALNGNPDVLECGDAPWDEGGPGVTLVRLS